MERIIQGIGLVVALGFIIFSLDDLIWDICNIVRTIQRKEPDRLPIDRLDSVPPKLLAVMVAAWHEDNVIEAVIDNMISSLQYPRAMYHVFIGVYPNDDATIDVVKKLEQKYSNVHMVVNGRPGPTCKADNVNNIIRFIKQFENQNHWRFCSVTIHDSEDVVHPYELKLTNYLLDSYDVLQFPVIPLQKMPTLKNVFSGMTIGTYADEFAENHYRAMGTREAMSAVVPSAGTGFVISHAILDSFGDEPLCPEDSLTEDYKLSLILAEKGYRTHFVLEKVPRLTDAHTVRWDYVATRSFFPETFHTAVRQKTRWIYGITMQSAKVSEIFKHSALGFTARYSLYKDLKAKLSNLMVLPGYMVFIYFIVSLFVDIPLMYPEHTLAYGLCVFLTFMMVFRQIMRAVAITNFYGFKSMAVACLLPPLMPVRLVWGNIINMAATLQAWKLFFFGKGTKKKKKKVAWSKTDHTFLQKQVLRRYYRNIGDILLEKQYVDVSTLSDALTISVKEGTRIGDVLLRQGLVSEEQLTEAAANANHRIFIGNLSGAAVDKSEISKDALEKMGIYPILKKDKGYVFAASEYVDKKEISRLLKLRPEDCRFVEASSKTVVNAIRGENASTEMQTIQKRFDAGMITWEQAVLAMDKHDFVPDILAYMGLKDDGYTRSVDIPQTQVIAAQLSI